MTQLDGHQKFQKAVSEIKPAKKDGKNPHFRSTYATLTACNESIKPVVDKYGLLVTHSVSQGVLVTSVYDGQEEVTSSSISLVAIDNMQKLGSAITYARRYNLCCLFNLDVEDDDGNAAAIKPAKNINNETNNKEFF